MCKFAFETHVHRVILKIILALTNLTSNFETHKNIGENFDYVYRFMFTLSMYRKGINIMKDTLDTKSELLYPKKEKSPTCLNF